MITAPASTLEPGNDGESGWNSTAVTPGERLFDDSVDVTRLQLVDHTITAAGNAVLTYSLRAGG